MLLSLYLPYDVSDARISLVRPASVDQAVDSINLTRVDQVDDQLRDWLSEAYDFNSSPNGS